VKDKLYNTNVQFTDRVSPMMNHVLTMAQCHEITAAPLMPQMFGNAGVEHMRKYGIFHFLAMILISFIDF